MNILVRLILLIVLFLTSQTGIASKTKFAIYQYDVNHTVLSEEVYGYDTGGNRRHPPIGNMNLVLNKTGYKDEIVFY